MFEKIIGNDNIKKQLEQVIKLNKISHSYLFVGTQGIGKKLIAKQFAKKILCLNNNIDEDNCKSCIEFDSNNNPDFVMIKPDGTSIKIEQIRNFQKKILEAPIISRKKVYIIDDADLMTVEAQNCLLKTLEEPPKFVNIILIGSDENKFLNTIKSRCTIIKFQEIAESELKKYIEEKFQDKQISQEIIELSQGSIKKLENILEKKEIYDIIIKLINNITNLDIIDFLKTSDFIYKSQEDINEILESLNIMLFKKSKENMQYLNCISIVEETKERINSNGNYNMCIDNMLFKIWEEMN